MYSEKNKEVGNEVYQEKKYLLLKIEHFYPKGIKIRLNYYYDTITQPYGKKLRTFLPKIYIKKNNVLQFCDKNSNHTCLMFIWSKLN